MIVRTWRAAARILGMSEDTLNRHRKRFGDRTRVPWWRSEDAVHDWYMALIAPPPVEPPTPRKPQPGRFDRVFDAKAIRAEIAAAAPQRRTTRARGQAVDQAALRAEILRDVDDGKKGRGR